MILDTNRSNSETQYLLFMVSYLVHYDTLLQHATDIIAKCHSYFNPKGEKCSLQNASILLQNASVQCIRYYLSTIEIQSALPCFECK